MPLLNDPTNQTVPKMARLYTALSMRGPRSTTSPAPNGYYAQDEDALPDEAAPKWSRLQSNLTLEGPKPYGTSRSLLRQSSSPLFLSSSYTAPTSMQFSGLSSGMRGNIDNAAVNAKSAADSAYGAMIRNLSRMGVNANSPRFAGSMRKWAAGRAAMEAGARNAAEREGANAASSRNYNMSQAMLSANEAERARQFSAAQAELARRQDEIQAARAEDAKTKEGERQARVALAEQRGYEEAIKAAQKAAGSASKSSAKSPAPSPLSDGGLLPSGLDFKAIESDYMARGLLPIFEEEPFRQQPQAQTAFRRLPSSQWNR
jgi:hypothetical protein